MSNDITINPENIEYWESVYSEKTDEELIAISEGSNQTYVTGVTAKIILAERREKFANLKHAELLAEIEKPHWSVTPSFIVGFVAMVAACIAAYPVLFPHSQAQQALPVVTQPVRTIQPANSTPTSSPQRSQHSASSQLSPPKR